MPVRIFWCLIQEDIFQKEAHNYYIIYAYHMHIIAVPKKI